MSVPTHNLYDFIHQVTENRYLVRYFYPWGSKNLENVIDLVRFDQDYKLHELLQLETKKLFNSGAKYFGWPSYQPVLFCHDQEPLNFHLYNNSKLNLRQCKTEKNEPTISYRKRWILLHSEENSMDLELYEKSGLFCLAHWWSHAIISRDWYRYAEYDTTLEHSTSKKTFLIYARASDGSRTYRQNFLEQIDKKICQVGSFEDGSVTSDSSASYNSYDFSHSDVSVVLETVVDRIHLTEKICRALACKHPFLLLAGVGSLKYLKRYGFKTFDKYIDESYDEEPDLEIRMQKILRQMQIIKTFSVEQLQGMRNIAEYNHKRFFSKGFHNQIVDELQHNVHKAHCDQLDGDLMWRHYKSKPKQNEKFQQQRPFILPLIRHSKKGGTINDYVPPWEK